MRAERVPEAERRNWARGRTAFLQGELGKNPPCVTLRCCSARPRRKVECAQYKRVGNVPDETEDDARTLYCQWNAHGASLSTKACRRVKRTIGTTVASKGLPHVCTPAKPWKSWRSSPQQWLEHFLRDKDISGKDRADHELRCLCDALEEAACFCSAHFGSLGLSGSRSKETEPDGRRSQTRRCTLSRVREVFDAAGRD